MISDNLASRVGGGKRETLCHNVSNLSQMLHYAFSTLFNLSAFYFPSYVLSYVLSSFIPAFAKS